MKVSGILAAAACLTSIASAAPLELWGHHGQSNNLVKGKSFDRFLFVVFENAGYNQVIVDPNFAGLTDRPDARLLTNLYAVGKPSLPNYFATIAGSTFGVRDDAEHNLGGMTIVDLLEAKGVSWKGTCYLGATDVYANGTAVKSSYRRVDNPFVSFINLQNNPNRCDKIVNAKEFEQDIANGTLPQFIYYIPNLKNNAHDTSVAYGGNYVKTFWNKYLHDKALMKNTLAFFTFDEDEDTEHNHIFGALIGGAVSVKPGSPKNVTDNTPYTLFSMPKTIEDNWNLGSLGTNDTFATPFKL